MSDDAFKFPRSSGEQDSPFEMGGEDQAAFEALMEAGFDVSAVAPELRERAAKAAALLGLIDGGMPSAAQESSETLIDLTVARVQRLAARESQMAVEMLSGRDEDALDALIGADYDPAAVAGPLRKRATRQADLLAMLEPTRAELAGSDARIRRTLDAVQSSIDAREKTFKLEPVAAVGRRFRVTDVLAVAALLLIASAAVGPMLGAMRDQARRSACQAGLMGAGQGFAAYATDWKDSLPLATASIAGNPWWYVGVPEKSNSANLYKTVSSGYSKMEQLACAGNAGACRQDRGPGATDWRSLNEVSFSFQNQFAKERPKWNAQRFLVLADASPVVRRAIQRRVINPFANSANHGGTGQNALFNDGAVEWLKSPVLASGDNIWLPGSAERRLGGHGRRATEADPIEGTESPETVNDTFVGP